MQILQFQSGYRYNSDSLILFDFAKQSKIFGDGIDIGSGSGILGLLAFPWLKSLDAIDLQEQNCAMTALNYLLNFGENFGEKKEKFQEFLEQIRAKKQLKIDEKFQVFNTDFADFKNEKLYDFAICNPPFYHKMHAKNEHLDISRHASYLPLDAIFCKISKILRPKARFFFCYDAKKIDEVFANSLQFKLKCIRFVLLRSKSDENAKLALFEFKKNSLNDIACESEIISWENGENSQKLKQIYADLKVESIDF